MTTISRPSLHRLAALAGLLVLGSCGGDAPAGPDGEPRIEFSVSRLELQSVRDQEVLVRNTGSASAGPVELAASPVRSEGGAVIPGSELRIQPDLIPALEPGGVVPVLLSLNLAEALSPGDYQVSVEARAGAAANLRSSLSLRFAVQAPPPPGEGGDGTGIVIDGSTQLRQGDVVAYQVETGSGTPVEPEVLTWSVIPAGAGFFGPGNRFVGYEPGPVRLVADLADEADTLDVEIVARGLDGSFAEVGEGPVVRRYTSDVWVHGDYAYTGTHASRSYQGTTYRGNTLYTWDVSRPSSPERVSSLTVDAGTVNDVKVRADGELAVLTHEGSSDGQNGITILDLGDPADPSTVTRYTRNLERGVHNVWIEGDYVYVVADGAAGLRIVDVSDPAAPSEVAAFHAGSSFVHDVYVRDGLAFVSHWDAGLVVLDVGNGTAGGSPESPVEVSRIRTQGGHVHNAWYWPEAGYAFVGEENFANPGRMHVVDLREPENPREVASFGVPGQTPHNFWVDESRGILYAAWYANGIRALDVSGELLGDLGPQGREIAALRYAGTGGTYTWAPQLHRGLVYLSDRNVGLVVLEPLF